MNDGQQAALVNRLTEARDQLARQIGILVSGGMDYGMKREVQVGDLIKQLRSTLGELEECIAELDDISE